MTKTELALTPRPIQDGASRLRAVIYLRVSTTKQADKDIDPEGYSLPAQRESCLRKAEELGADVVDEYIDRGESAKTADRPRFQLMLARIQEERDIDLVILDKVNRFARNRRDDANVLFELKSAGCQLVSVKENIDGTPAGALMHGILATLAEYESRNNGAEALKGMTRKAQVGGTPGKAPVGYLNVIEMVDGRSVRTIAIDPDRAPLVQWAYQEYATGQWTLNTMTEALIAKGLEAVPQGRRSPSPIARSMVAKILTNPYYLGIVTFRGEQYEGRHEPLVSQVLFDRVQEVLRLHGRSGERDRTHHHYLKGTLYCDSCGGRLCLTYAKGRYLYFFCVGRQAKHPGCSQRYVLASEIEVAVGDFYSMSVRLDEEDCRAIREGLRAVLEKRRKKAAPEAAAARNQLKDLEQQRRRVARGLVDGSLPPDLAREEQDRIRTELDVAQRTIASAELGFAAIERPLLRALELVGQCDELYREGDSKVRRLSNQAFFRQLRLRDKEVEESELLEPWRSFHDTAVVSQLRSAAGNRQSALVGTESSNNDYLVPPAGLEPAPPAPEAGALSAELRGRW
jgi:site-specific DNA recombinase